MNKEQFQSELQAHDWFHYMSDDHSVYTKGRHNINRLESAALQNEELIPLWNAWKEWRYKASQGLPAEEPKLENF